MLYYADGSNTMSVPFPKARVITRIMSFKHSLLQTSCFGPRQDDHINTCIRNDNIETYDTESEEYRGKLIILSVINKLHREASSSSSKNYQKENEFNGI